MNEGDWNRCSRTSSLIFFELRCGCVSVWENRSRNNLCMRRAQVIISTNTKCRWQTAGMFHLTVWKVACSPEAVSLSVLIMKFRTPRRRDPCLFSQYPEYLASRWCVVILDKWMKEHPWVNVPHLYPSVPGLQWHGTDFTSYYRTRTTGRVKMTRNLITFSMKIFHDIVRQIDPSSVSSDSVIRSFPSLLLSFPLWKMSELDQRIFKAFSTPTAH